MTRLKAALIGAGWWGAASHIPTLAGRPEVDLDSVCRLGADELERVRDHFGFAFGSQDHREVLARRPDIVIVSSPHHLHHQHARDALEAGAHVLIEKPMTLNAQEAWDLVAYAKRQDRHILVCNPYQYLPHVHDLRHLLMSGEAVGTIESVMCSFVSVTRSVFAGAEGLSKWKTTFFRPDRATWQDPAQGGGFAYGQLSHAIPLMLWLTGLEPRQVAARTIDHESVDLCDAATLQFESGAVGTLHGAAAMPEGHRALMRFIISGSEGVAMLEFDRDHCEIRRHDGRQVAPTVSKDEWVLDSSQPTHTLVDLALGRATNASPGHVGATTVAIIEAMLAAAKGRPVEIVRPAS